MTMPPKVPLGRSLGPGPAGAGAAARRISVSDMPRSPMSTNSSAHTCSDGEQESADKPQTKGPSSQHSPGEESGDGTAPDPPLVAKQEKTLPTGSILNLNLDRSKAEMDLKELSETVQQRQGATSVLTSPKRQIKSRFQLNLDKTIESCKAQLGIDEISDDVYKGVEHSDSEESDKSDSSDSEYASDEERKPKDGPDAPASDKNPKEPSLSKVPEPSSPSKDEESSPENIVASKSASSLSSPTAPDESLKDRPSADGDKKSPDRTKAASASPVSLEKPQLKEVVQRSVPVEDSDSERELVIDLGEEQAGKEKKRARKDNTLAKSTPAKVEAKLQPPPVTLSQSTTAPSTSSSATSQSSPVAIPVTMVPLPATSPVVISAATLSATTMSAAPATPTLKKQRPLLPRESMPVVQRAVVWNPTTKFQTSSQKWHMQKVQRQQLNQQPAADSTQLQAVSPGPGQAPTPPAQTQAPPAQTQATVAAATPTLTPMQPAQSTRYQTRQAVKVQQKDTPLSSSASSAVTLVTSSTASAAMAAVSSMACSSTSMPGDVQIPMASADVAADIAKYTNKIMDAIKGTMTEIYNDLSKSTSGNTIAETVQYNVLGRNTTLFQTVAVVLFRQIRRLRIEIEKLQWLHQQELSEMKHNLGKSHLNCH
ncbi:Protein kinase C-binding protein 1 [Merluccius polli]|uniref:Protein kinase C-binding protein 1 n=1 Tax=Merluccius polli TaxID=89951 RepID=A0AA47M9Q7_MERPO|nr:Protein kinase C-binding protein 1 [Merluccius polli]